jgi:histidinol-phosphate aminotransferase
MGSKVKTANMREYRHDLKAMLAAVTRRTKVVFIANPNNPTGTYVDAREVGHYMKSVPAGVMTVFDEAYREYVEEADFPSTVDYVKRGRNVIVLRTFSKIHSLAGLRVGYCIAPEPIIKSMNRIRPPFNVNTLAQAAAAACLKEAGRLKRCRGLVHGEKKRLERELDRLGVEYVPSVTNFMLIKCGNGGEMFKKLLSDGIIVRAMDEYELPGWIRVTVGKKNENDAFLRSFKKNLNEKS